MILPGMQLFCEVEMVQRQVDSKDQLCYLRSGSNRSHYNLPVNGAEPLGHFASGITQSESEK